MFLQIFILILIVNALVLVFRKFSLPSVLAMILTGVIFSFSEFNQFLNVGSTDFLRDIAKYGLFALMFVGGLEVSWAMLFKERRDSLVVAFCGLLVPFFSGAGLLLLLNYDLSVALTVGTILGITAEATRAKVLLELNKMKTRMAALMIGAGIFDDILGILLFTVVAVVFLGGGVEIAEFVNLAIIIFAFFFGLLAQLLFGREKRLIKYFEKVVGVLLIPLFFIEMGMQFEFSSLLNAWDLVLFVTVLAMITKILGVFLAKIFVKMSKRQAFLVGWGMNSRGAVGLALSYSAYRLGILNDDLYTAIIFMTFASTLIFPLVFNKMVKKYKGIMD